MHLDGRSQHKSRKRRSKQTVATALQAGETVAQKPKSVSLVNLGCPKNTVDVSLLPLIAAHDVQGKDSSYVQSNV